MDNLCSFGDKRRQMTVACWFFCRLDCRGNLPEHCSFCHLWQWEWMSDIMLDQLWPLYLPSGSVDEYLNHVLWLSLQLCASAPQNLSFLLIPVALASHFSLPPAPTLFSLCAFCLFIWEYDLSWWLREEIEKNVYFRKKKKKMSLTCLNVFF